jgi:hypothetical protein
LGKYRTLIGAGNSSSLINYSINDNPQYTGISYYRLKQTDFDGQFEYSKIKSINIEKLDNSHIEIYPNPFINKITVNADPTELQDISIFNTLGQDATAMILRNKKYDNELVLDVSNLKPGIYYLKTKTTAKIVIKL